jgi:hypothetical protein
MWVRSPKIQYALNERHDDKAHHCVLAAHRRDVVESSEQNPIVKPEKRQLKELECDGKTCSDIFASDLQVPFRILSRCESGQSEMVSVSRARLILGPDFSVSCRPSGSYRTVPRIEMASAAASTVCVS